MKFGTFPVELDTRDYSYNRTFGTTKPLFPDNYNVDIGKTMPDQNADGYFNGCTGYTQADNLGDELDSITKPPFTYERTCFMEGHDTTQPCSIRTSLKSTRVYGVQMLHEATEQEAAQHKGGPYFNVYDDTNLDWFDDIRAAILKEGKGASLGLPWFWPHVSSHGIMPTPTLLELDMARYSPFDIPWHNVACKGWKTIGGQPYLILKPWRGPNYGDKGFIYMSRDLTNTLMKIRGSAAFIQTHAKPEDIRTLKLDILETILVYLNRILGLTRLN